MTEPVRRPTVGSATVAGGCALLAVAVAALGSVTALAVAVLGAVAVCLGLVRGVEAVADLGSLGLFAGVIVGALAGSSVEVTLVGAVAAIVAWDLGRSAIDLGAQLGRDADTTRLEAVHAVSSALVGLVTVTVGYALYVFAAAGQPVWGIASLLVAATLLVVGLGVRR